MSDVVEAKVMRVPGTVTDVALSPGATVADALGQANITVGEGEAVKMNGSATTTDAVVPNGARIVVAKGAKGNS